MKMVYVVFGETGQYEDRIEWPVKVFKEKKKAEDFMERANEYAENIYKAHQQKWGPRPIKFKSPFDPNLQMDRSGAHYFYEVVPLENNNGG